MLHGTCLVNSSIWYEMANLLLQNLQWNVTVQLYRVRKKTVVTLYRNRLAINTVFLITLKLSNYSLSNYNTSLHIQLRVIIDLYMSYFTTNHFDSPQQNYHVMPHFTWQNYFYLTIYQQIKVISQNKFQTKCIT